MLNRTAPRFKRQKSNYRALTKGFGSFALFQIKCDHAPPILVTYQKMSSYSKDTRSIQHSPGSRDTCTQVAQVTVSKTDPTKSRQDRAAVVSATSWYPLWSTAPVLFTNHRLLNRHRLTTLVWAIDTWGKSFNTVGFCSVADIHGFISPIACRFLIS